MIKLVKLVPQTEIRSATVKKKDRSAVILSLICIGSWFLKIIALSFSADVERMFSEGKDVLKPKCACLSGEHFEMLALLKHWKF